MNHFQVRDLSLGPHSLIIIEMLCTVSELHRLGSHTPVLTSDSDGFSVFLQMLRVLLLSILILNQCESTPLSSQCVDESFCTYNLQDYYSQLVNLPNRINERSIATWSYV